MGGRGTEEGKEGTEGGELDGSHRDRVVARCGKREMGWHVDGTIKSKIRTTNEDRGTK